MKPSLSLRTSQQLALTPQLQQSIRLLQLSAWELQQEVERMLNDNPFLLAPDSTPDTAAEAAPNTAPDGPVWERTHAPTSRRDGDDDWVAETPCAAPSLSAFLHEQSRSLRLNADEAAALYFLIESLDGEGYLRDDLGSLADALLAQEAAWLTTAPNHTHDDWLAHLRAALHWLQHMEPTGVGARSLAECLTLQLKALPSSAITQAAQALCAQPLELLARRDVARLARLSGHDASTVQHALTLIARLEPQPARRFAAVEHNIITPDVIVTAQADEFLVRLNPAVQPHLQVHEAYARVLRQNPESASATLQQQLHEARWFVKSLEQRLETILRVARAIVVRQRRFLSDGVLAMQPLVLREIAATLGLHESTVSRVTSGKFMATPQGTFELKYFFASALATETGARTSSTAVRALIKQLVASEDARAPLSDGQIADLLQAHGIACARRTVAKYRETLKIAPAPLRKLL